MFSKKVRKTLIVIAKATTLMLLAYIVIAIEFC